MPTKEASPAKPAKKAAVKKAAAAAKKAAAPVADTTPVDDPGVASDLANAELSHTEGGTTTRADASDVGVPMLPGSPDEPIGPEDALGEGKTRGDYRERLGGEGYHPHETVAVADAEPGEPNVKVVPQKPRAEEIGDVPGKKGGVETAPTG